VADYSSKVTVSLQRREDPRLVTGSGRFVDDIDRPRQLWMRVVRSTQAHARIRSIDIAAAARMPRVHRILSGADVASLPRIPVRFDLPGHDVSSYLQPVLAQDTVRYVGEPIAAVVAEDPYVAEDAAELVSIEYEELPVVLDVRNSSEVQIHEGLSNEVATLTVGYGDVEAAFDHAKDIVRSEVRIGRHSGVPLETRGVLADFDIGTGVLEIWGFTKVPHFNRDVLAHMLGIASSRIHVHACDAGGGFGIRGEFYPEDLLVPYLSSVLQRPVKWIEDRAEHLVSANHSRQQEHVIEIALDADARILALRDEVWHDNGAYIRTHGLAVPELTASMLPGPYRVPAYGCKVHVRLTNKTPCGTYRAPGRFEGTYAREHVLDVAASRLGLDPIEIRRRNLLGPDEMPHSRAVSALGTEMVLDSGDYPGLFEKAIRAAGFAEWRAEARQLSEQGRLVGTGLGIFLEKSGLGPYEPAAVEVDTTGAVRVIIAGTSLGQGIETVMAQIVADELGVNPSDVDVICGDTNLAPIGFGSFASRSTVVAGSAVMLAARETADRAKQVAATLLEASPADLRLEEGRVRVAGSPAREVTLGEVAQALQAGRAQLDSGDRVLGSRQTFVTDRMTYPYGVHLAQVEVIPATGQVIVRRMFVAYDVGRAINRVLVQGQILGGAVQGIGGSLYEEFCYERDGQPKSASFMDYLLPTAAEVPRIGVLITEDSPAPGNPLGVKGAGEGGVTGCGAALASAVGDALGDVSAASQLPLTPERVLAAVVSRQQPTGANASESR